MKPTEPFNPFQYDTANDLDPEDIVQYYVEDYNFGRFIRSKRNVMILGERGSGKTMTLLYNSFPLQKLNSERKRLSLSLDELGVYVPCSTPLYQRQEINLAERVFDEARLSEHLLVLSIAYEILETVGCISELMDKEESETIRDELEFLFDLTLPPAKSPLEGMQKIIQLLNIHAQAKASTTEPVRIGAATYTLSSLVLPLIQTLRRIKKLRQTHFLLLIDDAHQLNIHQTRCLNSWLSFRDHQLFSFKVSAAKSELKTLETAGGGPLIEGHDYIRIDMEHPYQNEDSDFGQLAKKLVKQRISRLGLNIEPEDFFPPNSNMEAAIASHAETLREEAISKYGLTETRKISDYIYKFRRVRFYQAWPSKANHPELAGWSTIVFLSTGVIRNLLKPCSIMYDAALSRLRGEDTANSVIRKIEPRVQWDVIKGQSEALWAEVEDRLMAIPGTTAADAKHAKQLLDQLAQLFKRRLAKHASEPAANSFTISGPDDEHRTNLQKILNILRRAQYIYTRPGSAKDKSRRESYYIPNRMLWPVRGLDPHGQHARVSIPARELWLAAVKDRQIPSAVDERPQEELFDE